MLTKFCSNGKPAQEVRGEQASITAQGSQEIRAPVPLDQDAMSIDSTPPVHVDPPSQQDPAVTVQLPGLGELGEETTHRPLQHQLAQQSSVESSSSHPRATAHDSVQKKGHVSASILPSSSNGTKTGLGVKLQLIPDEKREKPRVAIDVSALNLPAAPSFKPSIPKTVIYGQKALPPLATAAQLRAEAPQPARKPKARPTTNPLIFRQPKKKAVISKPEDSMAVDKPDVQSPTQSQQPNDDVEMESTAAVQSAETLPTSKVGAAVAMDTVMQTGDANRPASEVRTIDTTSLTQLNDRLQPTNPIEIAGRQLRNTSVRQQIAARPPPPSRTGDKRKATANDELVSERRKRAARASTPVYEQAQDNAGTAAKAFKGPPATDGSADEEMTPAVIESVEVDTPHASVGKVISASVSGKKPHIPERLGLPKGDSMEGIEGADDESSGSGDPPSGSPSPTPSPSPSPRPLQQPGNGLANLNKNHSLKMDKVCCFINAPLQAITPWLVDLMLPRANLLRHFLHDAPGNATLFRRALTREQGDTNLDDFAEHMDYYWSLNMAIPRQVTQEVLSLLNELYDCPNNRDSSAYSLQACLANCLDAGGDMAYRNLDGYSQQESDTFVENLFDILAFAIPTQLLDLRRRIGLTEKRFNHCFHDGCPGTAPVPGPDAWSLNWQRPETIQADPYNLQDVVRSCLTFTMPRVDYICETCGVPGPVDIVHFYDHIPHHLCLVVDRGYFRPPNFMERHKCMRALDMGNGIITLPMPQLVMDENGAADLRFGAEVAYRVEAVVVHIGEEFGGGHYVCFRRDRDGRWWLFDDSYRQQVTWDMVVNPAKGRNMEYAVHSMVFMKALDVDDEEAREERSAAGKLTAEEQSAFFSSPWVFAPWCTAPPEPLPQLEQPAPQGLAADQQMQDDSMSEPQQGTAEPTTLGWTIDVTGGIPAPPRSESPQPADPEDDWGLDVGEIFGPARHEAE